jgi:hypothetical protein
VGVGGWYASAGAKITYLSTDRALGTGGGHYVRIDSYLRRDGSSNAVMTGHDEMAAILPANSMGAWGWNWVYCPESPELAVFTGMLSCFRVWLKNVMRGRLPG